MTIIAIAQLNLIVGNIQANIHTILSASQEAKTEGAEILLTPELSISGYPPEDLLLQPHFLEACRQGLLTLLDQLEDGITVIVGLPQRMGKETFNAACALRDGSVIATYHKMLLPNDAVFDEVRYFSPGAAATVFSHIAQNGEKLEIGLIICEDLWDIEPTAAAKELGAEIILALNASPYHVNKQAIREVLVRQRIEENGLPIIYCNAVGGQDELIFDGQSFAYDDKETLVMRLPAFETALSYLTLQDKQIFSGTLTPLETEEASIYHALVLALKDYLHKNGFTGVLLGLSGGIDSALALAIAFDAIGADNLHAVMMPSIYTAEISLEDAKTLATTLNVQYDEIAIQPLFDCFLQTLHPLFADLPLDHTEENLQARIRGTLLMALSNKTGKLVLTTSNKSEMTAGYSTLYGDMAGGFAVLKDISKTLVYQLARYRNRITPIIPERIIERAPSAELRPNQTDQDSLPDYAIIDAIVAGYVEHNLSKEALIKQGLPKDAVDQIVQLLRTNEYKRRQAPIGPRITQRAYGRDWRHPITNHFKQ